MKHMKHLKDLVISKMFHFEKEWENTGNVPFSIANYTVEVIARENMILVSFYRHNLFAVINCLRRISNDTASQFCGSFSF